MTAGGTPNKAGFEVICVKMFMRAGIFKAVEAMVRDSNPTPKLEFARGSQRLEK